MTNEDGFIKVGSTEERPTPVEAHAAKSSILLTEGMEAVETAEYPPALYDLVPFLVTVTGRDSVVYLLEQVHRPEMRSRILLRILELCDAEPGKGHGRDAALTVYLWVLALSGYSELMRVAAREVSEQRGCRMAGALVWLLVEDER